MERSGGSSSVPLRNLDRIDERGVPRRLRNAHRGTVGCKTPEIDRPGSGSSHHLPGTMAPMNSRNRPACASRLVVLAILVAACGSSAVTPSPPTQPSPTSQVTAGPTASSLPTGLASSAPPATPNASADQATYAQIEAQVEQLRQLAPKSPITPILLDEQGVRDWMTKATEQGVDHAALAAQSRLFAHLGLLPAGASLEQLELDLNAGQAIGFYDPDSKQLYLLSVTGSVGPEQRLTFSHEFTHALQDQNFGLGKLAIGTVDQSDRDLARTALAEGDATLSMTQWATARMSIVDLLSVSLSAGSGPQADQLAKAPAILREVLMFPYLDGQNFVQGIYARGGWSAVDRLYSKPPSSTSQILHPELYAAGVNPVVPTLAAAPASLGNGWKLAMADTMGELQLRVWLEGEQPTDTQTKTAAAAVSTWGGDRIGLFEGPNGAWAVVLRTQWRTASGRTGFVTAANQTLGALVSPSVVCGDSVHADIVIASDAATVAAFATCKPSL